MRTGRLVAPSTAAAAGKRKRLGSPERFEVKQLIAAGVLNAKDFPELYEEHGAQEEESGEGREDDLDVEVEMNPEEPPFLRGQTRTVLELSPVRVIKNPQGSLNRAAMAGATLAAERREEKRTATIVASKKFDVTAAAKKRDWKKLGGSVGQSAALC